VDPLAGPAADPQGDPAPGEADPEAAGREADSLLAGAYVPFASTMSNT